MSTDNTFPAAMQSLPLFREFSQAELETFLGLTEIVEVADGEAVMRQDEPGDAMFVLLEGTASVVHHRGGGSFELAQIGVGDFFGELALVDDGPRSADVIAVGPCRLLKIEASTIRAVAGVLPSAGFKLMLAVGRTLVQRARATNLKYIDSLLYAAKVQPE